MIKKLIHGVVCCSQRREAFVARKSADSNFGDTAADPVAAGIITQEQADAINAFLAK